MSVVSTRPIPARLSDAEIATLDELVSEGLAANRTDAIRIAIDRLGDALRRRRIGDEIVAGYTELPQTKEEIAVAHANAEGLLDPSGGLSTSEPGRHLAASLH